MTEIPLQLHGKNSVPKMSKVFCHWQNSFNAAYTSSNLAACIQETIPIIDPPAGQLVITFPILDINKLLVQNGANLLLQCSPMQALIH